MTDIQECAKKYLSLKNKIYTYKLENGVSFSIKFTDDNFYHLFGLHKLTDIAQITKLTNEKSKIFKKILSNEDSIIDKINNSKHYTEMKNRVLYFDYIDDLFDLKTCNIIVDFDVTLIPESKLKNTEFLLYRKLSDDSFFILTIGKRNDFLYPETILYEPTKMYISEQTLLEISDISIYAKTKKKKV